VKAQLRRIVERIDALTLRERVIVFGIAASLCVTIAYAFMIDPEFTRSARLSRDIAQRQGEARALQDQLNKLLQARDRDPDRENRERLARAKARLSAVNAEISAAERKFTAPAQMRPVMVEILARNKRVRLVDLRTVAPATITETRTASGSQAKPGATERLVYRHGLELTVAGAYLDLLGYLGDLERLPTQLYWGDLTLEATQYPTVTMKLTVFTLSLDRAWMNV
jgi:MSHA biogenesis protein MshJ